MLCLLVKYLHTMLVTLLPVLDNFCLRFHSFRTLMIMESYSVWHTCTCMFNKQNHHHLMTLPNVQHIQSYVLACALYRYTNEANEA